MQQEILDYIKSQPVGVLAVEMMDGSPHAATVHFANSENPLIFFFETDRHYRKAEALLGREVSRASFVIGTDESTMRTLQLDGEIRLLKDEEKQLFNDTYLGKFPKKVKKSEEPSTVFFVFIPKWWRFTDWTGPKGKIIISSEDEA